FNFIIFYSKKWLLLWLYSFVPTGQFVGGAIFNATDILSLRDIFEIMDKYHETVISSIIHDMIIRN
ncbi:hypothetical protein DBB36_13900, partial [Flavobacterium sp. WLB]|uniref:hypothetical protein n=1 Tax=Flavobacterium sp. WLB TaxID=2161662 RepID=UPI000DE75ED5